MCFLGCPSHAPDAIRFFANLPFAIRSGQIPVSRLRISARIMTPDPPSSPSEGQPLPPRHRPSLENLSKDTTELDLWAFEDDLDLGDMPSKPNVGVALRSTGPDIPAPRDQRTSKPREPRGNPLEGTPAGDRIQMNVSRGRPRASSDTPPMGLSLPESDFDDLEHWDDVPKGPQIDDLPQSPAPVAVIPEPAPEPVDAPAAAMPAEEPANEPRPPVTEPEDDEFSPVKRGDARPVSLQPHLGLSKTERFAMIALLALLVAGGLAIVVLSLNRLPTESSRTRTHDFPIKGTMVKVDSAASYWRPPITDGPSPETVRRGTKLLPVLELQISEGSGAIRVLFRDEERTVVGDAVTRVVRGSGTVIVAATAGFDDLGMHAAYRTGGSKPWTIEVYEAASETSPGKDFQRLFEMNISTDRR